MVLRLCRSDGWYHHADKSSSLSCQKLANLEAGGFVPSSCRFNEEGYNTVYHEGLFALNYYDVLPFNEESYETALLQNLYDDG
jgi:hypothetical protein